MFDDKDSKAFAAGSVAVAVANLFGQQPAGIRAAIPVCRSKDCIRKSWARRSD